MKRIALFLTTVCFSATATTVHTTVETAARALTALMLIVPAEHITFPTETKKTKSFSKPQHQNRYQTASRNAKLFNKKPGSYNKSHR